SLSSTTPAPTPPPLFPYTPLFRSRRRHLPLRLGDQRAARGPTRRQLRHAPQGEPGGGHRLRRLRPPRPRPPGDAFRRPRLPPPRSEEHTSELQSRFDLVCRPLLDN